MQTFQITIYDEPSIAQTEIFIPVISRTYRPGFTVTIIASLLTTAHRYTIAAVSSNNFIRFAAKKAYCP
ncbi:MAG: hypothetical protein K2G02_00220 [Phocaeicola sp.]|nr:hypothetical protein [Phocaeicola sp.]